MDIDLGAEFVYMAATLIHIKSRMLLPRDPALEKEGEEAEDPRQELVERLLEHERFQNAAEMLQQKAVNRRECLVEPAAEGIYLGERGSRPDGDAFSTW